MRELKRVLVPVDFSSCSLSALERAAMLAKSFGASLDVLHVYHAPPFIAPEAMVGYSSTTMGQTLSELVRTEAERGLEEFLEGARAKGIEVQNHRVVYGEPAASILEVAKEGNYDLIALGTHGRTGLSHMLLGSVAEKIVRRADRPVLTVREKAPAKAS